MKSKFRRRLEARIKNSGETIAKRLKRKRKKELEN